MEFLVQLQLGSLPKSFPNFLWANDRLFIWGNPTLNHFSHPQDTFYNLTGVGMHFSCISQLNSSIETSWYHVFHGIFL